MNDRALCDRAAAGDEHAFELLVEASRARLHGLVSGFVRTDIGLEREDALQLVLLEGWRALQRGARPAPGVDFYGFISQAARHRLITYSEHLRAAGRWTGRRPDSIEEISLDDGAPVLGSWVTHVDPLRVVLAREQLAACWSLTTQRQREAIDRWLRLGDTSKPVTDTLTCVRRKVRPMLADPYGRHPTLMVNRACKYCGGALTGDVRARVHRACSARYRWQQELARHVTPSMPLRLV